MTKNILVYLNKYKFHIMIFITVVILILVLKNRKIENLTLSNKSVLDNVFISNKCKEITPVKLFALFNNDLDKMTQSVIDNGISTDELADAKNYPKIASLLLEKKVIFSC